MSLSFVGSVRPCVKRAAMVAVGLCAVFASGGAWAALPAGYVELEYIEADNRQYLDTGYTPTALTMGFYVDFIFNNTVGQTDTASLLASSKFNGGMWGGLIVASWTSTPGGQLTFGGGFTNPGLVTGVRIQAELKNKHYTTTSAQDQTYQGQSYNCTGTDASKFAGSIYLFGRHTEDPSVALGLMRGRVYRFKIYEGDTVVRDFVPARNAQGEIGMIDIVGDAGFRVSATATPFIAGPLVATDCITIAGSPDDFGSPNPGYGAKTNVVRGTSYTFTCPAAWTNDAETVSAVCTGWTLALTNGTVASGTEFTKTITYGEETAFATLTWQWDVFYKVTAKAGTGGTVDKAEQWVKRGASAAFTATADAGLQFLYWRGDVRSFNASATFADVQSPFTVTAEFGDADWLVRYVAPADEDGDGSAASPYTNVNVAVASLATLGTATGAVVIAEGDYKLTETLTLTNAIRVIGMGMDKTKLKGTLLKGVNGGRNGSRGAYVDHKAAWMGGLTVTDCSTKYVNGCGVYLKRGTLDGVRSYANRSGLGEYIRPNNGVGLYMEGGLATNCVIESNVGEGGYGDRYGTGLTISSGTFTDGQVLNNVCNRNQSSGLGVYVSGSGAIVRNSLIQGNNAGSYQPGDYTYGMGVFMNQNGLVENCRIIGNSVQGVYMTSGTLRNCLVTGHKNSSTSYASGIDVRGGGKVVNCTVWGNTSANKFAGLYCDNSSALIVNNIVYGNGTDGDLKVTAGTCHTNLVGSVQLISTSKAVGNVASDPLFKDPSAGDFTFDNKSPASDKAAPRTDVTRDLVGVERPQNAGPDIGCFECLYEIKGLEVTVAVPRTDWNVGEAVTAEATVFGATGEVTYEWSVDDVVYAGQEGATATFTGLSSGRHTVSVKVSDGTQEASGSVSEPIAVKPTVVYVDDAKGNDAENYPYDDATKPAKTVNAAFDALGRTGSNTTTMHIAAGTYTLTKEVTLDTTVNVLGAGMDVTVLSGASLPSTARCLSLTKAGSRVVGLTLRDCKTLVSGAGLYMSANGWVEDVALRNNEIGMGGGSTPSSGVGLYQTDGTVTNCVISGNSQNSSYGTGSGVGVYITGGTLVDSVVTNNWRNRSQLCGAGVNASGTAKVLRCKIVGNSNKQGEWDSPTYGMGLCLSGGTVADCEIVNNGRQGVYASGGTIKNCLIAGSKTAPSGWAGGLQLLGATVINCTVGGNVSSTAAQGDLLMTSGKFQNSIAQYAVVTGGTLTHSLTNANPRFRNPARGDYRVFRSSPAVNTGDWTLFGKMKEGVKAATDLNGAPRLIADEIDMGCYENPFDGLLLLVK